MNEEQEKRELHELAIWLRFHPEKKPEEIIQDCIDRGDVTGPASYWLERWDKVKQTKVTVYVNQVTP